MNDIKNREMICYEKSTLEVFNKTDMICNPLHELIRNPDR